MLTYCEYIPEKSKEEVGSTDSILYQFFQESNRIESENKENSLEHMETFFYMIKEIVEGSKYGALKDQKTVRLSMINQYISVVTRVIDREAINIQGIKLQAFLVASIHRHNLINSLLNDEQG